ANGDQVLTGAAVAGIGAAVVLLADFGKSPAADAALEQTREQVDRTARLLGTDRQAALAHQIATLDLPTLDLLPERIVDDAKLGHVLDDPRLLRIKPRHPLSGIGVIDIALPVPDEPADVELVVKDARSTTPIAIDGGGAPGRPLGASNAIPVEAERDGAPRSTGPELPDDA